VTGMCDGWSPGLEHLTAQRFLSIHRDGRRGWCCPREGACRMLTWALDYRAARDALLGPPGETVPGQAAAILVRGVDPGATAGPARR